MCPLQLDSLGLYFSRSIHRSECTFMLIVQYFIEIA